VRFVFAFIAGLLLAQQAGAARRVIEVLPLHQDDRFYAPGSNPRSVRVTEQGEQVVTNVGQATVAIYLPTGKLATGAAVVVVPGGGHRELWIDHEGSNVANYLNAHGIAAFVLEYRLARAPNSTYTIEGDALGDLKLALRTVRMNAGKWKVDPHKVGVIGFSAGGQLAALAATRFDAGNAAAPEPVERENSRPDFVGLIYPGTWPDLKFAADTPPMFLLCGGDDKPEVVTQLTQIYLSLRALKIPAELHVYDRVGHGFGLRASNKGPIAAWPQEFVDWIGPTLAAH
jgi:acetyl esterase/lipase